jgi:hypothetical protein
MFSAVEDDDGFPLWLFTGIGFEEDLFLFTLHWLKNRQVARIKQTSLMRIEISAQ